MTNRTANICQALHRVVANAGRSDISSDYETAQNAGIESIKNIILRHNKLTKTLVDWTNTKSTYGRM
jgi:hypothetical protein